VRSLGWLVLVASCSGASDPPRGPEPAAPEAKPVPAAAAPDAPVVDPLAHRHGTVPAKRPAEAIVISYACSLHPHPPSTYFAYSSTSHDLDAGTVTRASSSGSKDTPPSQSSKTDKVPAATTATLRARLADVLAGGPYPPEYPQSGGRGCVLSLLVRGSDEPWFSVDRATDELADAITKLIAVAR